MIGELLLDAGSKAKDIHRTRTAKETEREQVKN